MAIILVTHNKDAIKLEPDSFGPMISRYLVDLAGPRRLEVLKTLFPTSPLTSAYS